MVVLIRLSREACLKFVSIPPCFANREPCNAKNVNAATHVIDPWPRYVGNRRIPGNGERMSGAVERYRDVTKLRQAPPPIFPIFGTAIGIGGYGGGGGGGGGGAGGGAGAGAGAGGAAGR